jgi:hypothetical protein
MELADIKKIANKYRFWGVLALVIFLVSGGFLFYYIKTGQSFDWGTSVRHYYNQRGKRLLDGKIVDKDLASLKPIAVMLENHFESRPVAGLEYASIIYEIIVEGDITRFLAIFDYDTDIKKIGPVRSARPFFVDLAEEWNGVYFHAGGSSDALNKLRTSKMPNINEISGDGIYFWRDRYRQAPHNLFTSSDLIKRAFDAKEIDSNAAFMPWSFKNDSPNQDISELVGEIEVAFSQEPLYQVKYIYNLKDNDYTRYLAGKVHKTDRGTILKAKNIILQYVDYDIIDSYGRIKVNLSGKGKAVIYQDGKKIEGYWEKIADRTYFYNQDGDQIKFNRGTIWVELLFN